MPDTPDTPAPSSTPSGQPLRLAVLLSGGGTTLLNLADRIDAGELTASIELVVASNDKAAGHDRALQRGLHSVVAARKSFSSPQAFSDHVFSLVREAKADLVCLAGFLSLLVIPPDFENRVVNIHPSLLPSFGGKGMHGRHVHEAVIAAGCKVSGCTVHIADNTYDTGPILVQRTCPVLPDDTPDTLAARVFEQECEAYPEAIAAVAAGRVRVADGRASVR